jgi:16S rRNA (cytosine1402-N4)-methyltransferase
MDKHISVLLNESIEGLNIKKDGIYVDATLGRAGHSSHILSKLSGKGKLYCFDKDNDAMEVSRNRLSAISPQFELIHSDFRKMKEELNKRGISSVDGILFDLGVSSPQLDNGERGFSYNYDARLDMRMNREDKLDAYTIVNTYSETDLRQLIFNYGDERYASSIARNIVEARKVKPIVTTFELVDIIKRSVPAKYLRETHPAKRTFQAIRIEVNDEMNGLKEALKDAMSLLKPKGRLVVITFHSLEDRIVKEAFKEASEPEKWNRYMPVTNVTSSVEFAIVNKKPIVASEEELSINRRSHSAKLRILEKN